MTSVIPRTKPGKFVYLSQLAKRSRYAAIALDIGSSGPRSRLVILPFAGIRAILLVATCNRDPTSWATGVAWRRRLSISLKNRSSCKY